jgi:hypothetical protein
VPRQVDVIDLLAALAGNRDSVESGDRTPTTEVPVIAATNEIDVAPTVPVAPAAPAAESPGLIRVEKIIEELQALTASPRLLTAMKQRQAAPVEPVSTIEPVVDSSATRASAAVVAPKGALLGTPRALAPTVDDATGAIPAEWAPAAMTIDVVADVDQSEFDEPMGSGPSQRQVELAVAAADQLIESLTRDESVKRLSVRIVLRTAGNDEVEAGAEWESNG